MLPDKKVVRQKLKSVPVIDLGELLSSKSISWEKVQKFFLEGEFDEERYLTEAIKLYLRMPDQKTILEQLDLTIADCLNGRYGDKESTAISQIYDDWNNKLGFVHFRG